MTDRRKVAIISVLAVFLIIPGLSGRTAQEQKPEQKPEAKQEQKQKKVPKKPRAIRVLFIGGSFIYYNNLPDILAKLAQAGGAGTVETAMVALSGWGLKDHWQKGDAHRVMRDSDWNFIVLEDESLPGKDANPEGGPGGGPVEAFRTYARNFAQSVQDVGAVPVFYLTWAPKGAPEQQAALNSAYFGVAKEVGAKVAPAGIAWAEVREHHPEIELYAADGAHPTPAGSYLAACSIYAAIFGRNPEGLPAKISGRPVNPETGKVESDKPQVLLDLPPAQAKVLQQAAWAAKKLLDKNRGYLDVSRPPAR